MIRSNKQSIKLATIIAPLFLLLLCVILYFTGIGDYGLLSKDEPRYAGCALEMIENNDWIYPKFNFQDRFDKPALFYWLIAISYKLFGVNEFTSRLPSAICATFTVLFTWFFGKKTLGNKFGLLAGLVLASSVEFIILGRRAATDIVLCLFTSGIFYSLFLAYNYQNNFKRNLWTIIAGIFAGLSMLTKGPVGIVLVSAVYGCFVLLIRDFDFKKHFRLAFIMAIAALVVSLPWYIAVHIATDGAFTQAFFLEHNLNRFSSVVGEHPGPVWFYIPVILGGFMPWTPFLLLTIAVISKRLKSIFKTKHITLSGKLTAFAASWFLVIFVFFSASKTKLATYIILLYPALALLAAYGLWLLSKKSLKSLKIIMATCLAILVPVASFLAFLIKEWKYQNPEELNTLFYKLVGSIVLVAVLGLITLLFIKRNSLLIPSFALSLIIPGMFVFNSYLPMYYNYKSAELRNLALEAKALGAKEIIALDLYKPVLSYYSRIPVDFKFNRSSKEQIQKIKELKANNEEIFVVAKLNMIEARKKLFQGISIEKQGRKYFLGKFN